MLDMCCICGLSAPEVELPSFPLVLTREQAGLDPSVRFILGNVMAETARAQKPEDLAPIITAMVGFLDAALSYYFDIAEEAAANVSDLLDPAGTFDRTCGP